jgi:hypothetical protein
MLRVTVLLSVFAVGLGGPGCRGDAEPDASARPQGPAPWPVYVSAACGFRVRLPFARAQAPIPEGVLDQIATENASAEVAIVASCTAIDPSDAQEQRLALASARIVEGLGGEVRRREPIELDGRRGVALDLRIPADRKPAGAPWSGELDHRVRIYAAPGREIQLHVMRSGEAPDDLAEAVFDGFEFLP